MVGGSIALPGKNLCIIVCCAITWLDTRPASFIGPRSCGLSWRSQRVRKARARVVPVHHPAKDLLPLRSFRTHWTGIVAARSDGLKSVLTWP